MSGILAPILVQYMVTVRLAAGANAMRDGLVTSAIATQILLAAAAARARMVDACVHQNFRVQDARCATILALALFVNMIGISVRVMK